MLVEVGKKYVVNWRHEQEFKNKADLTGNAKVDGADELLRTLELSSGRTLCFIKTIDGEFNIEGIVYCSKKERYDKAQGRKRSLRKALAAGGFTKTERTVFWGVYNSRKKVAKAA